MMRWAFSLVLLLLPAFPLQAEERVTLGVARLYSNDRIGDGQDRWRTGSYAISVLSGPEWTGHLPDRFGQIVELRFRSDIIAPSALYGPGSDDRRYAGALTYGMHTHLALWQGEASAGIDLTMTGPQTGLADFQNRMHERLSAPKLSDDVIAAQIPDGLYPSVTLEYARPLRFGERALLRPFVEVQTGVEDIARIGGDLILGGLGQRDLLVRDNTTGWLMRATHAPEGRFSVVAGADWAQVGDSVFLPDATGPMAEETRIRARLGMNWQPRPRMSVFYGITWLSEEFETQPEGQLLGSLSVRLGF